MTGWKAPPGPCHVEDSEQWPRTYPNRRFASVKGQRPVGRRPRLESPGLLPARWAISAMCRGWPPIGMTATARDRALPQPQDDQPDDAQARGEQADRKDDPAGQLVS